ncbi:hypothetical protein B0H67DRAFT_321397 [Lasiosphaeris hirsuta]|uniref:Uncharacterized protein n=1 Tax=Lasiosphaeris hirsuta TaxID=260670 RepID=A0AA40A1R4_9PEZI|nr:hypothetical protein B0H67DRAFT_321397 [Lasiosphaeris hirsuta]
MSPTQQPQAFIDEAAVQQPEPAQLRALHTTQPPRSQAMDPQRPHPESDIGLRGGDRGGMCPGRFCFCIPCPIPCDCCFIPL